jgi:uncharacterized protein
MTNKTNPLTVADVLQRYKEEDLPAFCGVPLNDVNQVGLFGERPLHVACVRGNLEEMGALIQGGADVNAPGEHGYTALHEAVSQGNVSAVRFLLAHGARLDMRNDFGQTALDIAHMQGQSELATLLKTP